MGNLKEKILKLRDEGKSYNEISVILNCAKSTISFHCKNNFVNKRIDGKDLTYSDKIIDEVKNLYIEGKTRKEISEILNVSLSFLNKFKNFKKLHVKEKNEPQYIPDGIHLNFYEIISTCKGGGYMYCRTKPKHPKSNSNGLYPLHRVLMENKIGRNLNENEIVHHIDENKENNHVDNLMLMKNDEHAKHHVKNVERVVIVCPICKHEFQLLPSIYKRRNKKYKQIFCSRTCQHESLRKKC